MPDRNEGNAGRKTQRLCFVFPLHVLFFVFFHNMFIVSSKATFFFLPSFKDDGLVPLFSKCRTEMTEIPNEKLKDYALVLLFSKCRTEMTEMPNEKLKVSHARGSSHDVIRMILS
uniref:Uncharacterized protein n=1 Tax=Glycine max TaxID=3847 RepID=A0A0R0K7J3_SOYBN